MPFPLGLGNTRPIPLPDAVVPTFVAPNPHAPGGVVPESHDYIRLAVAKDEAISQFLRDVDKFAFAPFGGAPGSRALDPELYDDWLVNVGAKLGVGGILLFTATQ